MAEVSRINRHDKLDMIGDFAMKFGQHPDKVYEQTSFDTVANFLISWKDRAEFDERYMEADKLMNPQ